MEKKIKNHDESELWKYKNMGSWHIVIVYRIDNVYRTTGESIQYLVENYNMTLEESAKYISEIKPN